MTEYPDALFHYTTQAGLLGILASNTLWATKIHYLNDSSEYELALGLARDILESRRKQASNGKTLRKVDTLIENLASIVRLNVCVCSFSSKNDLLSQWRAYGGTSGYSLAFSTTEINQQAAQQGFSLVACIYDELTQRSLIETLVDESLAQEFNTDPSRIDEKRARVIMALATGGEFAGKLALLAPLLKSAAFREESEWRLVSKGGVHFGQMSFRPGHSMITPYVSFSLGHSVAAYLRSVTVGPTPHPSLAESAVYALLASSGAAKNVKIHMSTVPELVTT